MRNFGNMKIVVMVFSLIIPGFSSAQEIKPNNEKPVQIGAYYFDGWAGVNKNITLTKNGASFPAPTHLTKRMLEEFPDREPIWGWRDDSLSIMIQQIDWAAKHGISFFSFCWYWHDDSQEMNVEKVENDPKHTSLNLFINSPNNSKMKFCLMISNHKGFKIKGTENWKSAAKVWMKYFTNPQYLMVDGKPVVFIFDGNSGSKEAFSEIEKIAVASGLKGVTFVACGKYVSSSGFSYQSDYNVAPVTSDETLEVSANELFEAHQLNLLKERNYPYIPVISAGWDRRPWEGKDGRGQEPGKFVSERSSELFSKTLNSTIDWMNKNPEKTSNERIILIYAWNELGEGGYIVPTKGDPDGKYLQEIKKITQSK